MSQPRTSPRLILLVEDNEADAELIREHLSAHRPQRYTVHHVTHFRDALALVRTLPVDAVLLDLFVPDALTSAGVHAIRALAGDVPVLMLTGLGDEDVALECLDAGAQDFLSKGDLTGAGLVLAVEQSIARQKAVDSLAVHRCLERERRFAAGGVLAVLDSGPAALGEPLRNRSPDAFEGFVEEYGALLRIYAERSGEAEHACARAMTVLAGTFVELGAGARDLLDVHTAIIAALQQDPLAAEHRPLVLEGRLFALEMMGLLSEHYRCARGQPLAVPAPA